MYGETDFLLKIPRYLVVEKNNIWSSIIPIYEPKPSSEAILRYSIF